MGIPDNIKKYRKKANLTQRQLAKLINKKEITVRRYEKGDITPPISVILDIAIALGVPSEKILANDNKIIYEKTNNGQIITLNVPFEEIESTVDEHFPTLEPMIQLLSNPKIEMIYNFTYNELAAHGYEELLFTAIEKTIKNTLQDIKDHENNGDIFDGISAWITKESPLYEILKQNQANNQIKYTIAIQDDNFDKKNKKKITYDNFETVAAHNDNLTNAEIEEADRRILEDINKKNTPST